MDECRRTWGHAERRIQGDPHRDCCGQAAERRRLEGNSLFKGGDAADAAGKYTLAMSYLDEDFLMQLEGPHFDQVGQIRVT